MWLIVLREKRAGKKPGRLLAKMEGSYRSQKGAARAGQKIADGYQIPSSALLCVEKVPAKRKAPKKRKKPTATKRKRASAKKRPNPKHSAPKRKNPHIPTGAKIIKAGGVLVGRKSRAKHDVTVGPYQSATSGSGYAVIEHGGIGSDSRKTFKGAPAAMREFSRRVGKANTYKAIQAYQMKHGSRVGVQTRGRAVRKRR